ncbi:response regulator [Amycolatopsis anabasis]|uniref:response regulator n=1 Tax=Amycolatopsis anabasis TaxID=1840409 RepID=UPI00131ACD3E|nr:response regulator transcription factor [Amycolatopsis anabasis]
MIRVALVDDDPMVCEHLRAVFDFADDIEVVDETYDGAAAVESVLRHRPDVVLMDLRMPGVDGLTAIERIHKLDRPPAVVALTTFDADHHILRALRAGAAGFLLKTTPPQDLIGLVRVAADGHTVLSPAASRRLVATATDRHTARDEALAVIGHLTPRETDILACLGNGLSNAQIAARMHLTEGTTKNYISQILAKLQCANRTQAGLLAQQAGL